MSDTRTHMQNLDYSYLTGDSKIDDILQEIPITAIYRLLPSIRALREVVHNGRDPVEFYRAIDDFYFLPDLPYMNELLEELEEYGQRLVEEKNASVPIYQPQKSGSHKEEPGQRPEEDITTKLFTLAPPRSQYEQLVKPNLAFCFMERYRHTGGISYKLSYTVPEGYAFPDKLYGVLSQDIYSLMKKSGLYFEDVSIIVYLHPVQQNGQLNRYTVIIWHESVDERIIDYTTREYKGLGIWMELDRYTLDEDIADALLDDDAKDILSRLRRNVRPCGTCGKPIHKLEEVYVNLNPRDGELKYHTIQHGNNLSTMTEKLKLKTRFFKG
ncbi:hypothetical protein JW930_05915 [Candidatus Woesearchaeota archaeon]|nr:hypothetical protein [Candidatus Woesearchaeota archaeon]